MPENERSRPAEDRAARDSLTSVADINDFEALIAQWCERRSAERAGKRLSDGAHRVLRNRMLAEILGKDPDWRPVNEAEVDVWGNGYNAGWRQGYAAAVANV